MCGDGVGFWAMDSNALSYSPLDTDIGGERPTVQLVEVTKNGDRYSFDFASLNAGCHAVGAE